MLTQQTVMQCVYVTQVVVMRVELLQQLGLLHVIWPCRYCQCGLLAARGHRRCPVCALMHIRCVVYSLGRA